jgi:hypothetical protein
MNTQTLFTKAFTFAAFATAASYAGSAAAQQQQQQQAAARNVPDVRPVSALGQGKGPAASGGLLHLTAE